MNTVVRLLKAISFQIILVAALAGCEAPSFSNSSNSNSDHSGGSASSDHSGSSASNEQVSAYTYKIISKINALSPRKEESAAFTGTEVLFFGGWFPDGTQVPGLASGAAYDVYADTWRNLSSAPEARVQHTAVWSGSQMLVWGGKPSSFGQYSKGVLIYDILSDSWKTVNAPGEPDPRADHSAVWTGSEMIIWGGRTSNNYSNGARFNPVNGVWAPVSGINAPSPRIQHSAVWTGNEMVVFGGLDVEHPSTISKTAKAYDPKTDSWRDYDVSSFRPRAFSAVGWSNNQLYLWGGIMADVAPYGLIYNPQIPSATDDILKGSKIPSFNVGVWIGSQWLLWGIHQLLPSSAAQDGVIFSFPDK